MRCATDQCPKRRLRAGSSRTTSSSSGSPEPGASLLSRAPTSDFGLLAGGIGAFTAELGWFEGLASERGVGLDAEPAPDAVAYLSYLTELSGAPYPVAMTGMWAVELAYLEAWRGALGGAERYAAVIEHWANDEFAVFVERLAAVADRELGAALDHHEAAEVAFRRVLEHEARFWGLGTAP